jgi:aspartate racemase
MKCLGIIGGIAPESTIDYYRQIIARYRQRVSAGYPSIIINSIDLTKMLAMVSAGQHDRLVTYMCEEIGKLARAGADFGLIASNTPHVVFDEIRRLAPIPMISIVEAAAEAANAGNLKRVGLFATRFTMRGGFYGEVFARFGITVVLPDETEQEYIHAKYIGELVDGRYTGELVNGIFLPETRAGLLEIIGRMARRDRIEALILGGTELPLILHDKDEAAVPLLDTTAIHVERAVAEMLE